MRLPLAALLALALAGCSPEAEPEQNAQANAVEENWNVAPAEPPAVVVPAPKEAAVNSAESAAASGKGVRRCGWLHNPTPGNWWLTDSEDQWILGTQGADQAPGMDEMRDMTTAGWVETNGYYGYGCACMTITSDAKGKVTRITDASPKPLKQCRADRKLPKPD